MNKNLQYLKNSYKRNRNVPVGSLLISGLNVYIKDPFTSEINIERCLEYIAHRIPSPLISNVKSLTIGNFSFLRKREAEGIFRDGTIYITNRQESEQAFIADVIHEIAHSFEEKENIHQDQVLVEEFLQKRQRMYEILLSYDLLSDFLTKKDFLNVHYSEKFDNYLYRQMGYEKINNLVGDIFISAYAATCLREYFANAFEYFFVKDMFLVKKYAPSVYNKLISYLEI